MKSCKEIDDQTKCNNYIKATFFDRCMFLKFDEYCSNGDFKENIEMIDKEKEN